MAWMIDEYIWTTAGGTWAHREYPETDRWWHPLDGLPTPGWVSWEEERDGG